MISWYARPADFNPRSHKGSDEEIKTPVVLSADFNPRSHKGSDYLPSRCYRKSKHFNPRSHKGSDSVDDFSHTLIGISIHAPTRGATPSGGSGSKNRFKFQSTLPQGERLEPLARPVATDYFNPRSHKGSDGGDMGADKGVEISIHAPTRGATEEHRVKFVSIKISIHAPTRGATRNQPILQPGTGEFQSTLPQGERLEANTSSNLSDNFNPRSHKGSDI